ncbi:MAG: AAA family ATPase [Candidatus Eisenbacteria bacterium]
MTSTISSVVVGQDQIVEILLVALFSEGHVLLEGPPGTGKTLLARTFAACLDLEFARIQFTPDLMPGDVLGTNLFDFRTGRVPGSRAARSSPTSCWPTRSTGRLQAATALLQAMQERTVTIDGKTYPLKDEFLVVATQNPIEQEGTIPAGSAARPLPLQGTRAVPVLARRRSGS